MGSVLSNAQAKGVSVSESRIPDTDSVVVAMIAAAHDIAASESTGKTEAIRKYTKAFNEAYREIAETVQGPRPRAG